MTEHRLITECREIVKNQTAATLHRETGERIGDAFEPDHTQFAPLFKGEGLLVDLFSASAVVEVFDNLNEENRNSVPGMIERVGVPSFVGKMLQVVTRVRNKGK